MTQATEKNIVAMVITAIILIAIVSIKWACEREPLPVTDGGRTRIDTFYSVCWLAPDTDTVRVTVYVKSKTPQGVDTVWKEKVDTLFKGLPPFSLTSGEYVTGKRDTLTAQYEYPLNRFIFKVAYSADTTATIHKTEYVMPSKFQLGISVGTGLGVDFGGTVRPCVFFGAAVNYKL